MVAAAAAPAFAASPCTTTACPDVSFGAVGAANSTTAGNGWSYAQTQSPGTWNNTNPTGFQPPVTSGTDPMNGKGPWFGATSEPNTANRILTLTQTGQPELIAGCTYTVSFGVVTFTNDTSQALLVRAFVGATQVGQYTTAAEPSAGYTDRGIKSFAVPAGTTGAVSFRFLFGAAGSHEDIKLYQPSVLCA